MKTTSAAILAGVTMILAMAGFFPTYFSHFPKFEGVPAAHHFHGAMMTTWFVMLIAQPILITNNKMELHRLLGKASYVLAPLVVISIYLAARLEYYDDMSKYTQERSLAGLDVDLMSIFQFTVLYSLAIINRHRTPFHMRYMICTALLIFIPGLARLFIFVLGLSGMVTGMSIMLLTYGTYITLIIYDWRKGNPVKPYLVGIGLLVLTDLVVMNNKSVAWQWLAGQVVAIAF